VFCHGLQTLETIKALNVRPVKLRGINLRTHLYIIDFFSWLNSLKHLTWSLLGVEGLQPLQSLDWTSEILSKLLYGSFLIMGVVMLLNMLIALLSKTYQNVEVKIRYLAIISQTRDLQ
jgi:hypothetical protein